MFFGSIVNKLGASVRRALSQYAVGANEPELALNFIDNEYITNNSTSTFASAITHVRNGNATMTDGYGPELVVNGDFLSNIDDWSVSNGTASWVGGQLLLNETGSDGVTARAYQTITTVVGTTYWVTARVGDVSTGTGIVAASDSTSIGGKPQQNSSGNATVSFAFVAEATTTYIVLAVSGTTARTVYFDNVSVREMPVIKWAPHNLLTYSEQFDNAAWSKTRCTITSNQAVAPDGSLTADLMTATDADARLQGNITNTSFFVTQSIWVKSATGSNVSGQIDFAGLDVLAFTANNEWQQVSTTSTNLSFSDLCRVRITNSGDSLYVWGAHLYRSDLGGMVDNPDQPPSRSSYVPTEATEVQLPRIGHHVYNGSAWVNEGVLAESESRTNEFTYSNDFTNAAWVTINAASMTLDAVGPDGVDNSAATLVDDNSGGTGTVLIQENVTVSTSTAYTFSVYAKKDQANGVMLYHANFTTPANNGWIFNLEDGTITEYLATPASTATIEDVGNGWYRCAVTFTTDASDTAGDCRIYVADGSNIAPDLDGTSSVLIYGAQFEEGSTPSSLIPTSGSTVTRAAETFTIPSANLPWPTPQYIGSEIVDNGGFDSASDWTISSADAASEISGGQAYIESGGSNAALSQTIPTVSGKVYELSFDLVAEVGASQQGLAYVRQNNTDIVPVNTLNVGIHNLVFVAEANDVVLKFMTYGNDGQSFTLDDVSVREINPLSVSIGMEGRMTYADTGALEAVNWRWHIDGSNTLGAYIYTTGAETGELNVFHVANGVTDQVISSASYYAPDILVPYNITSRHGSTFVNAALEGVALTANTTPTALPDLSSTDLSLAYDYMGTISEFRVWDKDLGDDGIVEATNPSLEPSLSLEFSGLGTNSFTVSDWSE
jgi:hypothetical protein